MSERHSNKDESSDLSEALRVDQVCDGFEAAWKFGLQPRIEDYLSEVSQEGISALLAKLLALELAYRSLRGETPRQQDYRSRFPEHADVVSTAFRELGFAVDGEPKPSAFGKMSSPGRRGPDKSAVTLFASGAPDAPSRTPVPDMIGRYVVDDLLGEGGFGSVYLCFDKELERQVAIKVPRMERLDWERALDTFLAETPDSQGALDTFLAEARTAAKLKHPGIVTVHDVIQEKSLCYIVSEYIEGGNLRERSRRKRLSHSETAVLVAQVAEALHFAHLQDVIHRDIKPANILLDLKDRPRVVDFGLAIRVDDLPGERGRRAGTLAYMSPEQVRGEGHRIDARTDIYSLGVVLYQLLCGKLPFAAESESELCEQIQYQDARTPRTIDDGIPPALERICLKAISKRVTERYTTAKDMAEELELAAKWMTAALPIPTADSSVTRREPESTGPPAPRVVPKGLRAFEAVDADFFLQLLPGPRDRNGLPDSIRFWKSRIENLHAEESFAVGLIYGPSGCGKSSLVRAGLIPRLANHVIPIYIEATAEGTERRLLAVLRKACPGLKKCSDVCKAFLEIRRGRLLPTGSKICIVLDQFEQWLHSHGEGAEEQSRESLLIEAMRQADGEHLQCLLMIRDDFWVSISRVFQRLEVPLVEDRNSRLVDLFDLRHARHVLELFGRAYDCLPQDPKELSDRQKTFLGQALRGLSEQGKVISVRLSLFADMIKGRPWTPRTLAAVGGTEGIGITFLEETFCSRTAPPEHRLHQEAAKAVLRHLLPAHGTEIRSKICSRDELLRVSGYTRRPQDFGRLIHLLDTELRIITPTDVGSASHSSESKLSDADALPDAHGSSYQLTHDYLVPSLREWLNRKRRETRRGRAELLLEERTEEWIHSQHTRHLPSLSESLRIALHTRRAERTECQRKMLRKASLVHGRRMAVAAILLVSLAFALALLIPKPPSQPEVLARFSAPTASTQARVGLFDRLHINNADTFLGVVEVLKKDDDPDVIRHALPRLFELAEEVPQTDPADTSRSVRTEVADLLRDLLGHDSEDVQVKAFNFYSKLALPQAVLETIRSRAGQVGKNATDAMGEYVRVRLVLPKLSDKERSKAIRSLIALIEEDANDTLVGACVAKLDHVKPEQLLTWLIEAYQSPAVETAVEDSLVPYAGKTSSGRVDAIGRSVEKRLAELVDRIKRRTATAIEQTFELEFLVHALKELQPLGTIHYDTGLKTLIYILEHPEDVLLDPDDMLVPVIETFARLNHDNRRLDLLREILTNDERDTFVRGAAATAISNLKDLESFSILETLATDPETSATLRAEAIEGLRKLGLFLQRKEPTSRRLREIATILRNLLEKHEELPMDVALEALTCYGDLGDSDHVHLVFPLLIKSSLDVSAIAAVQSILIREPGSADKVVSSYLTWRKNVKPHLYQLREDPDMALIGFGSGRGTTTTESAPKSVVAALKKAQAEHEDEWCREYAGKLLGRLLQANHAAPKIDPGADGQTRASQLERWLRWREESKSQFKLIAGRLVRTSQAS